ncbi:hypothetical protein AGABI1DRAFT_131509 [Agaricus bisporus var. burnettii JB137-S8]|uniref:Integral membrane protein n=1 Tax=Agaricus bisporus var. burnettii (strain JB137-S8 / ATCC MYA-4627 / FGSC 10392) TaxID=597362 RepID=K5VP06_AGABU|nr:uncharacterized protein AGABI1DRAFT_131509 [Agaricus bisporus var. burnettii JB137-S8]EKM76189.1 hypothetical protein AGABI1DRAFT_131509 [Agaricus bisporus var. burnettii JB137-S8]
MPTTPPPAEQILTPEVYLNHFSPAEAHEEEIRRDITMVLVGVVLWDVFTYIPSDIRIIRKSPFRSTILSFIISRLMIVVYMINVMLRRTLPVDYYLDTLWHITVAAVLLLIISSSYLFLRRVLAIYSTEKWVRRCFIASWVIHSITSAIVVPLGGDPSLFPGTGYFKSAKLKPWVATCDWGMLAFDTAVVVGISVKLGRSFSDSEYRHNDGNKVSWYGVLTGRHLPRFSRAIVRGGQLYYL